MKTCKDNNTECDFESKQIETTIKGMDCIKIVNICNKCGREEVISCEFTETAKIKSTGLPICS